MCFFFSSRRRTTRFALVSWARRCVSETGPDTKRKITAFYASFLELGDFLSSEAAWLTIGTLRTSVAKNIIGGISNVVRQLLRAMFVGPTSLAVGGAVLQSGLFFARFRRILSDEAAGKAVFCVKGALGLKPCMDCKNVVALQGATTTV